LNETCGSTYADPRSRRACTGAATSAYGVDQAVALPGGRALQRHDLLWLHPAAWERLHRQVMPGDGPRDAVFDRVLAHWRQHDLPVVVRRALDAPLLVETGPATPPPPCIAIGLPAPVRWQRRRFALVVHQSEVGAVGAFPRLAELVRGGAGWLRADRLLAGLDACGAEARVYGSHGWQWLSGLTYVRDGSDVDLAIAVGGASQANAVADTLDQDSAVRIDGELMFPDGRAVAWREWKAMRDARVCQVMVKRVDGVTLASAASFETPDDGATSSCLPSVAAPMHGMADPAWRAPR